MPIDVLINPEQVVTENIHELLRHPGALQVLDFAEGIGSASGHEGIPKWTAGGSCY